MQSDVRRREGASGWLVAVVPFLVGVAILTSVVFFLARTANAVPRPPRPTIEQVFIFDCESTSWKLQERVNDWLFIASGEVRIVGRTFSASRSCYSAAIFYEKLVKPPADDKPPVEKE